MVNILNCKIISVYFKRLFHRLTKTGNIIRVTLEIQKLGDKMGNINSFFKTTKKFLQNNGEMIFECCYHFSWNKNSENAGKLIDETKMGYVCRNCKSTFSEKEYSQINRIIEYINSGGRDDNKLKKLYSGVDVYEYAVSSPGHIVENSAEIDFSSSLLEESFGLKKF